MHDAKTSAAISALTEEIDSIHQENSVYWAQAEHQSLEARAEHKARQDRLEKIRAELTELRGNANGSGSRQRSTLADAT